MPADKPRKHDIVLRESKDGGWCVLQDGVERLSPGVGVHLTDQDRAEASGDDIARYENVDLWLYENGKYALLKSYRGVLTA
ncbi:MAG: hypothetical protein HYX76_10825 [Acidobacteria bacterium]|nr:hypothetical protein [Acidobacteriota bacterium]